ncbi:hypothetical protein NDS46_20525 [Paenibacillus thiaminolyticus]|uniref:hypothetical protein n=1 Tax=Paenibacillus thiaminolyticus TaxID=49283 RepID=UPI00232D85C8|nr:hypothetical protein [Paenibacillus thiaminolyticus]WCF06717.1 hypothetical protein NDS46_20525 [Paenibacillus thiaminolyticus]
MMRIFSWQGQNDNKLDRLAFELKVEIKKEFKNISKHKRILSSVIYSSLDLYINGDKLDPDEVFDVDVFFTSLVSQGTFPMFTCTCGIFGCGGYYVEVKNLDEKVIWRTQQSPFMDRTIKCSNTFVFSRSHITDFAEELIQKFEELKSLMLEHGLVCGYDIEKYKIIIKNLKRREL